MINNYKKATAIHFATKHFVVVKDIRSVIAELDETEDDHYFHITTHDNRELYFTKSNIMYMEEGVLEDNTVFRDMEYIKLKNIEY